MKGAVTRRAVVARTQARAAYIRDALGIEAHLISNCNHARGYGLDVVVWDGDVPDDVRAAVLPCFMIRGNRIEFTVTGSGAEATESGHP